MAYGDKLIMAYGDKPLGGKAYGSIGHLPGSRLGPSDRSINPGQARIATERVRDGRDRVIVQEKLDGSCVSVARIDGEIFALGRSGYLATTSRFEQHHLWAEYVAQRVLLFKALLSDGERFVGEWLAMAHGTRYDLSWRDPIVFFDLMRGSDRATYEEFTGRTDYFVVRPKVLATGPTSIEDALIALGTHGHYGALDPAEGCVWRVERGDEVDFLAKYVRPDKVDGSYFANETWNWLPSALAR